MSENKPAVVKENKVDKSKSPWTQEQVNLICNTVAKGATPDELKLFLYIASRSGLDPLTRQIHFVKRAGQMTVQTGIDGYRAIAERTKSLAGIDDAIYDNETEKAPKKASVTVWRFINGVRVGFTASARWSEYAPTGSQAFMWNKMPYLMLAKCAEALALRKAFPNDLSGLYTNEEMAQADNNNGQVVNSVTVISTAKPLEESEVTKQKQAILAELIRLGLKKEEISNVDNIQAAVKKYTNIELLPANYIAIIDALKKVILKTPIEAQVVTKNAPAPISTTTKKVSKPAVEGVTPTKLTLLRRIANSVRVAADDETLLSYCQFVLEDDNVKKVEDLTLEQADKVISILSKSGKEENA